MSREQEDLIDKAIREYEIYLYLRPDDSEAMSRLERLRGNKKGGHHNDALLSELTLPVIS